MATIQAVIFDLDGTLVDTEPAAAQTVSEWFAARGRAVSPADATYVTGRTWKSAAAYLLQKHPVPISVDEACKQLSEKYREHLKDGFVTLPGSREAVERLAPHYPLALVSGSLREEIFWILNKLKIENLFSQILGAEDYPHSKPAPDGYLKAIHLLGKTPAQTLVFEDSKAGISSARTAGAWVVAVTAANHFNQDTGEAHLQIPDFKGVTSEWVKALAFPARPC